MICRVGVAALLAFLFVVNNPGAAQGDDVETRASQHEDFARLVFEWPAPVKFSAAVVGRVLIVNFERDIATDLSVIPKLAPDYAASARHLNGNTVHVELKRPVRVVNRRDGNMIIVDLHRSQAAPAPSGQPPPAKATASPKIVVRSGEHETKSRLVVDWPQRVEFRVITNLRDIIVRFDRAAKFDLRRVRANRLRYVDAVEDGQAKNGSLLRVRKPANAQVRYFRIGRKFVLDISKPRDTATNRSKKATETPVAAKPARDKTQEPLPAADRKVAAADHSTDKKTEKTADRSGDSDNGKVAGKGENAPDAGDIPISHLGKQADKATSPPAKMEKQTTEPPVDTKPAVAAPEENLAAIEPHRDPSKLRIVKRDDENTLRLVFPFKSPVAAAGFERLDRLLLVFEQPLTAELPSDTAKANGIINISQLQHSTATVLQLELPTGRHPYLYRDQAVWILELSEQARPLSKTIPVIARPRADGGPKVYFPSVDNGNQISLIDQLSGETILVVPTRQSAAGIEKTQRFVDFLVFASVQGIALKPIREGLALAVTRDKVFVSAEAGLAISPPNMTVGRRRDISGEMRAKNPVMDLLGWRGDENESFVARKALLTTHLARASEPVRNRARFELAKFYLGHGLAQEALGLMGLIDEKDPSFANGHVYRAARGVANLLSNRLDAAGQDLLHSDLTRYPDVALWRGALHTRTRKFEEAVAAFPVGINRIQDQPEYLRWRLLEDWMVAASSTGDEQNFTVASEILGSESTDKRARAMLAWMRGRQALRDEHLGKALKHLDEAIAYDYRPVRAWALLDRADVELKLELIDPLMAIKKIDLLDFAWRGDSFEVARIQKLAALQIALAQYGDALKLLREGVARFADEPEAQQMADNMNQVFEDLFLNAAADNLDPLRALGLYFDFKELTPVGRKGDKMIRRLADRLANVDLLGQAADLLNHQIKFRLKGGDMAKVGARLAVILLLDKKPAAALQALDNSAARLASETVKTERKYLRARALAENDASEKALALIAGDISRTADLLRAEIHWREERWADAASALESLLGERWTDETPLSQLESQQIVQLAVAEYLSEDSAALAQVRQDYDQLMQKSEYAGMFKVITHRVDPSTTKFRDLAPAIASISSFEAFMENYRKKLKSGGVSALN